MPLHGKRAGRPPVLQAQNAAASLLFLRLSHQPYTHATQQEHATSLAPDTQHAVCPLPSPGGCPKDPPACRLCTARLRLACRACRPASFSMSATPCPRPNALPRRHSLPNPSFNLAPPPIPPMHAHTPAQPPTLDPDPMQPSPTSRPSRLHPAHHHDVLSLDASGSGPQSVMTSLWHDHTSLMASGVPMPAPRGSPAGPNQWFWGAPARVGGGAGPEGHRPGAHDKTMHGVHVRACVRVRFACVWYVNARERSERSVM